MTLDNTKFIALKIQQLMGYGAQAVDVGTANRTEVVGTLIDYMKLQSDSVGNNPKAGTQN